MKLSNISYPGGGPVSRRGLRHLAVDEWPEGYTLGEVQWLDRPVRPGEFISTTGTVEQVYEQLKTLNPNYDTDFAVAERSLEAREINNCPSRFKESDVNIFSWGKISKMGLRLPAPSVGKMSSPAKWGAFLNDLSQLRLVLFGSRLERYSQSRCSTYVMRRSKGILA